MARNSRNLIRFHRKVGFLSAFSSKQVHLLPAGPTKMLKREFQIAFSRSPRDGTPLENICSICPQKCLRCAHAQAFNSALFNFPSRMLPDAIQHLFHAVGEMRSSAIAANNGASRV